MFYCYGNRTNKFLLLNYGFCFPDNKYDSYEFPMRLDLPINEGFVPEIIDLGWQSRINQKMRLKKGQICFVMVAYLRYVLQRSYLLKRVAKEPVKTEAMSV